MVQPTLRWSCWLPAHSACVFRSWQVVQSSLASLPRQLSDLLDLRLVPAAVDVRLARPVAALAALRGRRAVRIERPGMCPSRGLVLVAPETGVLPHVLSLLGRRRLHDRRLPVAADAVPAKAVKPATRPAVTTPRQEAPAE